MFRNNRNQPLASTLRHEPCKHEWRSVWSDYYSACEECLKCKESRVWTYGQ